MSYNRVIPRDLFNEALLLKCLGRLFVLMEENPCLSHSFDSTGPGFVVRQDPSDGSIEVVNVRCRIAGVGRIRLFTPLNARSTYPLYATYGKDEEVSVLDEQGQLTAEFRDLLEHQDHAPAH